MAALEGPLFHGTPSRWFRPQWFPGVYLSAQRTGFSHFVIYADFQGRNRENPHFWQNQPEVGHPF